ncbi:MAG: NUDIX domain-containing protein [Gammaproteobacteria bacterium]|nr:NUDIX domain-containing protein [Gammaproteobacteria bacterium]
MTRFAPPQHRTHLPATFEPRPQAAVAMILADGEDDLEVCFIRRAERAGDPWSGQVAFPGGRAGRDDRNAHDVAERETWEEIGLSLAADHRIGPLPIREAVRPTSKTASRCRPSSTTSAPAARSWTTPATPMKWPTCSGCLCATCSRRVPPPSSTIPSAVWPRPFRAFSSATR